MAPSPNVWKSSLKRVTFVAESVCKNSTGSSAKQPSWGRCTGVLALLVRVGMLARPFSCVSIDTYGLSQLDATNGVKQPIR